MLANMSDVRQAEARLPEIVSMLTGLAKSLDTTDSSGKSADAGKGKGGR